MGMFDWVEFVMDCPKCGGPVSGFQTKDTDCILDTVSPLACRHFYGKCGGFWANIGEQTAPCGSWVDVTQIPTANFMVKASPPSGDVGGEVEIRILIKEDGSYDVVEDS